MSDDRPNARLLVDEDLSPVVAQRLRSEDGLDAVHVRDRGLLGEHDCRVLERAFCEDRVLVTANVGDFANLAGSRELHAGIVLVLDGQLLRDEQLAIVRQAVAIIQREAVEGRDMVNRVLRISADGTHELVESSAPVPSGD